MVQGDGGTMLDKMLGKRSAVRGRHVPHICLALPRRPVSFNFRPGTPYIRLNYVEYAGKGW